MAAVLVLFVVLYPMGWLLYGSFLTKSPFDPGNLTISNYVVAYSDPNLAKTVATTFLFASTQTVLGVALGGAMAWVVVRTDTPFRRVFEFLMMVMFLLPSISMVVAWTLLLSPTRGVLNDLLHLVFPDSPSFDIYGLSGMILVQVLSVAPFAYLIIAPVFAATDATLEEAARISGSNQLQTLFRITLPVSRPALVSAAILLFIVGIEAFDIPQLLGAPKGLYTFTSLIFYAVQVQQPPDWGVATALATSLQLVSLACIFLYRRAVRATSKYETIKGKGYRAGVIKLGAARWVVFAICAFFFTIAVGLPILMTLLVSVVPFFSGISPELFKHLTFSNYERLFHHPALVNGTLNSLTLAVFGAAVCVLISAMISSLIAKQRTWSAGVLESLSMLPIAVPATVLAVGLLWAWITVPAPIYGTLAILAVAYVTRYIPLGVRSTVASLVQIGTELEEASTVAGATRVVTFRRIVLPLAAGSLFATWSLLFMIFFREFSMSILLSGPGNPVLSVILYDYYESAEVGPLCAASLILVLATLAIVAIVQRALRPASARY
jgi:iron(III) transport system permease protein